MPGGDMNRREFVAASSAVAAALACRSSPAGTLAESRVPFDVACVLFDQRFEASRAFGSAALRLNQRVYGIDGDVTALWTERLDPLWSGGSGAVAGMTTATSFVCLEQLAAQHWFRVIGRVEHRPEDDEAVSHRINAEPDWRERLRAGLQHPAWPQHFVAALLSCGRRGVRMKEARFLSTSRNWLDTPPLISWYIAGRTEGYATLEAVTGRPEVDI
jgi:hypothetical protein